jgi:group I intron endonuclease
MPAIYGIRNRATGKLYVGKTVNARSRFARHKSLLKNNKHWNLYLQRSYNKYGHNAFDYVVLEECEENNLARNEQKWIDANRPNVYNGDLYVLDKNGSRNGFYGKKHSSLSRMKMAKAKQNKYDGEANPNYGKTWNEFQRSKMRGSKNQNSRLTESDVITIKKLLENGHKHKDIAEKFHVARTVITRINSGTRWSHINGGSNANRV